MVNRVSDVAANTQFIMDSKTIDIVIQGETVVSTQENNNPSSNGEEAPVLLPAAKAVKMTDSMNKFLETTNTELRFKYHEELDKYYVTLVNAKTAEVVREIPSKKLMDMYAAMLDFVGIFVDKKI